VASGAGARSCRTRLSRAALSRGITAFDTKRHAASADLMAEDDERVGALERTK
jgi:hypothetical protein